VPPRLRIGCSSWTSDAWWGRVYPEGIKEGDRLALYAQIFDTVEVDSSYYRPPGRFLLSRWVRVTPEDFVFTLKMTRDLLDPREPLDRNGLERFTQDAKVLGPKLGPILLQFPPWVKPGRATSFLGELLDALDPSLRYAVELRDKGWFQGETGAALRRDLEERRMALTWSYLTYVDVPPVVTTDFVYLRFIGDHTTVPEEIHGSLQVDRRDVLHLWAERWKASLKERSLEGFVYFNNHFQGFAPASANLFREEVGLPPLDLGRALAQAPSAGPRSRQTRLGTPPAAPR
jgi:uncharacterized protein YecE (DUF72 family)